MQTNSNKSLGICWTIFYCQCLVLLVFVRSDLCRLIILLICFKPNCCCSYFENHSKIQRYLKNKNKIKNKERNIANIQWCFYLTDYAHNHFSLTIFSFSFYVRCPFITWAFIDFLSFDYFSNIYCFTNPLCVFLYGFLVNSFCSKFSSWLHIAFA